jgi:glycosyltransferase domain-containing protein
MSEKITLVVPTMNRSEFLLRLLHYYWDLRFPGWISIGDSSDVGHVERTRKAIKSLQGELRIQYEEYPGLNFSACMKRLAESVSTPYAAYVSDDDFLVPRGLEQCVAFLETHPDYAAAHGIGILFRLDRSGAYGDVKCIIGLPRGQIEGETAVQRLSEHSRGSFFAPYSVRRAETLRSIHHHGELPMEWSWKDEALPGALVGGIRR